MYVLLNCLLYIDRFNVKFLYFKICEGYVGKNNNKYIYKFLDSLIFRDNFFF
ncbi:hypothetical protein MtrunA17_Chr4g0027791 [Medicago truncatula]|uniref:Uncharacterized protein n=1 Tax=Medicago truncatula TaxID=3880 RepID=A0A396ICS2_MEDTR|nr:hypothetical protein MtrunA17_Chr4g0027791 [Medicago truncatula]